MRRRWSLTHSTATRSATRCGVSPHAERPACSRCAPCPRCSRPSSCRRCRTPRRRARCASILKPDDAARLRRSQALRSGLRQDTVGRAYSRAGLTPWTAQVDQLPKWQDGHDGQGANPQRRIAAPAPDCASHCNEGCEPTPRRLGPPARRPSLLPTCSPTRLMWPIVGASAFARQSRPLPAHRADLTFPCNDRHGGSVQTGLSDAANNSRMSGFCGGPDKRFSLRKSYLPTGESKC